MGSKSIKIQADTLKITKTPQIKLFKNIGIPCVNKNDIYITASKNDPCSNALLEGLACGLPALYLNSGAHSELVKKAGLPFNNVDEINSQLNKLIENYLEYQKQIDIPDLDIITTKWIELFESVE